MEHLQTYLAELEKYVAAHRAVLYRLSWGHHDLGAILRTNNPDADESC